MYQQPPPPPGYGPPAPPHPGYAYPPHPGGPYYPPPPLQQGYAVDPMAPPMVQAMIPDSNLAIYNTVVVRQVTQWGEILAQAVGIPYEQANKYKISAAPPGVVAASSNDDPKRWKIDHGTLLNLPAVMNAVEESSTCDRIMLTACGCLNLRGFTMHYNDAVNSEKFRLERPCKCGAWCCCPLELTVKSGPVTVGRVEEDCGWCSSRCCAACCACTTYARVLEAEGSGSYKHIFTTRTSTACCGRVNNCCGATCCKDVLVIDVLDPGEDKILTHINKVYAGGGGCAACCRMMQDLNNYVISFPPGMSLNQRMLLMGAMMHINYQVFEKTGDENGGGD